MREREDPREKGEEGGRLRKWIGGERKVCRGVWSLKGGVWGLMEKEKERRGGEER